jgi:hypothetical protein
MTSADERYWFRRRGGGESKLFMPKEKKNPK